MSNWAQSKWFQKLEKTLLPEDPLEETWVWFKIMLVMAVIGAAIAVVIIGGWGLLWTVVKWILKKILIIFAIYACWELATKPNKGWGGLF